VPDVAQWETGKHDHAVDPAWDVRVALAQLLGKAGRVGQDQRVGRHGAGVAGRPAAGDVDVVAVRVFLEGDDTELGRQGEDVVLGRADEHPARFDDGAVRQRVIEHAPAHPVARLEDDHRTARPRYLVGGDHPGDSGADHRHIHSGRQPAGGLRLAAGITAPGGAGATR
jgi:hypothetical protein